VAIKIVKKYEFRQRWFAGKKRKSGISEIVIHGTGGSKGADPSSGRGGQGVLKWVATNKAGASNYKKGIALFHYLVTEAGSIYEVISPARWCNHASIGGLDEKTIGIETYNPKSDNSEKLTKPQFDALINLIQFIMEKANIKTISGHGARQASTSKIYKVCPGENFDWKGIQDWLKSQGYSFDIKAIPYDYVRTGNGKIRKPGRSMEFITNITKGGTPTPITKPDGSPPKSRSDSHTEQRMQQ